MTAITLDRPLRDHGTVRHRPAAHRDGAPALLREPMVAVGLLGFPLVTMLVIAGVFGQVPDPEFGGVAPDDHYIAGYIGVVLGRPRASSRCPCSSRRTGSSA